MVDRRRDRAVAGPGGRDDRHARADRAAAQLRRPGRGAGRLERLPARRGRPRRRRGRGCCRLQDLLGIHSAEVFIGVFIGAVTFTGSIVAFLKLSARIKSSPLMLPGKNVLNLGALVAFVALTVWFVIDPQLWLLVVVTVARARARLAPGRLDRRRRHAGRGLDAQQLLRLGRRRVGLPARQRPADHHRRPGRLLRCLPVLHHVQGDEPLVHLRHRRRLRHRGRARPTTPTTASTARSPPRASPSCSRPPTP